MRRNLDRVTGALSGKRPGNKWHYECPAHPEGDHLIVREKEGKELYHSTSWRSAAIVPLGWAGVNADRCYNPYQSGMMTAEDVLEVMRCLKQGRIPVWLDGGWGVDALLEEQTREHEDLDLVMELGLSDDAQQILRGLGYEPKLDERPTRLELRDTGNRQVDLHTVVFDEGGGGVQHLQDGRSYRYPPSGFKGHGKVAGQVLPCMTAQVQLQCHLGYEPTDIDRHDVNLLIERFHLPRPSGY